MAAGKIKIIVDEKNFVGSTDPFRAIAKKYWTRERGSSFKILNASFDSETGTEISSNGMPFDINFVGETSRIESERFYEFEQKIVLKANQNRVDNESDPSTAWESLVGELFSSGISGLSDSNTYHDHAFSIDLPYTENELKLLNITQKVSSANVKPEYNFYIEGYEEKIQKQKVPELALPNLYALKLAEIQGTEEQFIQDSDLDGLITMGGLVTADLNTVLQQRRHPREDIGTVSEKPNHTYHKDIVNNYAAMASKKKTTLDRILKRASTISLGNGPIGNSTLGKQEAPSFLVNFLVGECTGSSYYLTGALPTLKIPQVDIDLEYETMFSFDETSGTQSLRGKGGIELGGVFPDGSRIEVAEDHILLEIIENNTDFAAKNFDIEVFLIEETDARNFKTPGIDKPAKKDSLVPKYFVKPKPNIINNILLDPDEEVAINLDLDSNYVQHYFDVYVDREIDADIMCSAIPKDRADEMYDEIGFDCPDTAPAAEDSSAVNNNDQESCD